MFLYHDIGTVDRYGSGPDDDSGGRYDGFNPSELYHHSDFTSPQDDRVFGGHATGDHKEYESTAPWHASGRDDGSERWHRDSDLSDGASQPVSKPPVDAVVVVELVSDTLVVVVVPVGVAGSAAGAGPAATGDAGPDHTAEQLLSASLAADGASDAAAAGFGCTRTRARQTPGHDERKHEQRLHYFPMFSAQRGQTVEPIHRRCRTEVRGMARTAVSSASSPRRHLRCVRFSAHRDTSPRYSVNVSTL